MQTPNRFIPSLVALTVGLAGTTVLGQQSSKPSASSKPTKTIVETAIAAPGFETLVAAVKAADLVGVLSSDGPFTVLAPTDAAFAKLPEGTLASLLKPENKDQLAGILKYHVLSGQTRSKAAAGAGAVDTVAGKPVAFAVSNGRLTVNDASIVKTDLACSNGVIHVIDTVLLPPKGKADSKKKMTPSKKTIVETAIATKGFETLVAAVKAADLVETLSGDGPFTVLAPTDAAFAALPKGTLKTLLKPENKQKLATILTYHVVAGSVMATQAAGAGTTKTVAGLPVEFDLVDGQMMVNNAKIVMTDIPCSNGVIHVIDAVLLPPEKTNKKTSSNAGSKARASARASVRDLIELATERGSVLFNQGQAEACAAIYEVTIAALLSQQNSVLDRADRRALARASRKAKHTHDAHKQAWALRAGLDAVFERRMVAAKH